MLSKQNALDIAVNAFPDAQITDPVEYKDLFLMQIFKPDDDEGGFDPFYSVNQTTGELLEFPLFSQDSVADVLALFERRGDD